MPKNEPDATDPMTLTGVEVPATEEDVVAMATAFAEEFAFSGWDAPRIAAMFQNPFYAGPHLAWRTLGKARVTAIIEQSVRPLRRNHAQRQ
ncbi:MAG: hypothetical protein ACT4PV_06605 [Planctomycetaceae bacterium]